LNLVSNRGIARRRVDTIALGPDETVGLGMIAQRSRTLMAVVQLRQENLMADHTAWLGYSNHPTFTAKQGAMRD